MLCFFFLLKEDTTRGLLTHPDGGAFAPFGPRRLNAALNRERNDSPLLFLLTHRRAGEAPPDSCFRKLQSITASRHNRPLYFEGSV